MGDGRAVKGMGQCFRAVFSLFRFPSSHESRQNGRTDEGEGGGDGELTGMGDVRAGDNDGSNASFGIGNGRNLDCNKGIWTKWECR